MRAGRGFRDESSAYVTLMVFDSAGARGSGKWMIKYEYGL
jgi:hypothetical protein